MSLLSTYLGICQHCPEEKIMRTLIELAAQFVGANNGSLLVVDEKSGELVFALTTPEDNAAVGQRVPLGKGIVGLAAQTHEVQIGAPTFRIKQPEEPSVVIAAPMLIDDSLVGVIAAVSFQPGKFFTSADAMFYGRIAAVAGVVVDQHRRLCAVEAIQKGQRLPTPIREEERMDREIVETIQRILRSRPDVRSGVARLLSDVESLVKS